MKAALLATVLAGTALGAEPEFPRPDPATLPAQELFRDWPPRELLNEAYWLPWSDLAFLRAGLFGRPVLFVLTVGWNHSAHETLHRTLQSPAVLATINQGYVAVLVDADRRPDIRERYLTGAWPVIAFLLPNGQPMLSQVNERKVARPITTTAVDDEQLRFLLVEGLKYWAKWPQLLVEVADEWTRREAVDAAVGGVIDEQASDQVALWLAANRDGAGGGFGVAPKFLAAGFVEYAGLRAARLRPELVEHAGRTLDLLVASPLYDTVSGGLRRMAAAPGFGAVQQEKLLETNADWLRELSFALRLGIGDGTALRAALAGTAAYVTRELARPDGGFYHAQCGFTADGAPGAGEIERLVLSGPNALAGAALVRAGHALDDAHLVDAGRRALELVRTRGLASGGGVLHVIEPDPTPRVFLAAHADTAFAFVDAYESLGDRRYLDAARSIVDFAELYLRGTPPSAALLDHLPEGQALGLLANPRRPLIANVRLARTMRRLALHGLGDGYRERAREILSHYAGDLAAYQVHGLEAGVAVEELIREPLSIRVIGDGSRAQALVRAAVGSPWAFSVVRRGAERGSAAAELEFRGRVERVVDPAALREAVLRLTGGTPR